MLVPVIVSWYVPTVFFWAVISMVACAVPPFDCGVSTIGVKVNVTPSLGGEKEPLRVTSSTKVAD